MINFICKFYKTFYRLQLFWGDIDIVLACNRCKVLNKKDETQSKEGFLPLTTNWIVSMEGQDRDYYAVTIFT